MLNVEGLVLEPQDRELLCHPTVGGVILFSRNYESPVQLQQLVAEIRALREPKLLVAVDQEGGRVQRFRKGFTSLPPAARIGALYERDKLRALELAHQLGWLLSSELRCFGVDFSFAPVLDLKKHRGGAIGERAFHTDAQTVAELARAQMRGLTEGGMVAVGKHFPGHGSVEVDSHHQTPVDERDLETIRQTDLLVFERMIHYGLAAVMSSHIVFPAVDESLVTCSYRWLTEILRHEIGFGGAVFSDDLSMQGAGLAGDCTARSQAALEAGCDMILLCNDRASALDVVGNLRWHADPVSSARLARMRGTQGVSYESLAESARYLETRRQLLELEPTPELDLD